MYIWFRVFLLLICQIVDYHTKNHTKKLYFPQKVLNTLAPSGNCCRVSQHHNFCIKTFVFYKLSDKSKYFFVLIDKMSQKSFLWFNIYWICRDIFWPYDPMPGWRIDPDSRPRFKELVEDFTIMARDPSRYVFILVRAFFYMLPLWTIRII